MHALGKLKSYGVINSRSRYFVYHFRKEIQIWI